MSITFGEMGFASTVTGASATPSVNGYIGTLAGLPYHIDPAATPDAYQALVAAIAADEVTVVEYAEPVISAAQQWASYQAIARATLSDSDLTVLRCYESGVQIPAAWVTYRKGLRAIVGSASGDPTQPLPAKPEYPAGT